MNLPREFRTHPKRPYNADELMRPSAMVPGQRVVLLLGKDSSVGSDSESVFLVTDGKDKQSNPLLIELRTGKMVSAHPAGVWATA